MNREDSFMQKFNLLFFIDDDEATNFYHEIIVKDAKVCHEYRFFDSPEIALNYFERIEKGEDLPLPDLIFLDINMPKIDGWEFMNIYHQFAIPHSPFVIMLTTSLNPKDQEKAKDYDLIIDFMNKPLEESHFKKLYQKLNQVNTN